MSLKMFYLQIDKWNRNKQKSPNWNDNEDIYLLLSYIYISHVLYYHIYISLTCFILSYKESSVGWTLETVCGSLVPCLWFQFSFNSGWLPQWRKDDITMGTWGTMLPWSCPAGRRKDRVHISKISLRDSLRSTLGRVTASRQEPLCS